MITKNAAAITVKAMNSATIGSDAFSSTRAFVSRAAFSEPVQERRESKVP